MWTPLAFCLKLKGILLCCEGMLHHLDLLLNMLILLRYFSLDLLPLLVLPSLGPTWLLSGYGWLWESWKQLRRIVVTIFPGVPQTSYHSMGGKCQVLSLSVEISHVIHCLIWSFNWASSLPELIFMTIITVCCTPSLETTHQLLLTWIGKQWACSCCTSISPFG